MTNRTILEQVGPFLRNKDGRHYRKRNDAAQAKFLRAVAYRWKTLNPYLHVCTTRSDQVFKPKRQQAMFLDRSRLIDIMTELIG
ncbi:hypothetical protein ACROYT_G016806 [Oculina patagonica]